VIFAIASITDYFDGKIAREQNLVTDFGKFLDPMADKILVLSAMICMIPRGLCNPVVVIIVAAREFLVSSLRLVAASQGVVIAAGKSGKLKAASQMLSIVLILALESLQCLTGFDIPTHTISNILMWLTAGITVYSGGEYLLKNQRFIDPRK
jgi:CDP-diacylglycerol--glycerol-3-phosphate 3-phosphatidyltransferase